MKIFEKTEVAMQKLLVSTILAVVLSACASLDPMSPEEIVAARAQQRFDALMVDDYEAAYQFASPAYRTTESVSRYSSRWGGAGMWLSATVQSTSCPGVQPIKRCKVSAEIVYRPPRHEALSTALIEDWLLIDGNWYLYQEIGE